MPLTNGGSAVIGNHLPPVGSSRTPPMAPASSVSPESSLASVLAPSALNGGTPSKAGTMPGLESLGQATWQSLRNSGVSQNSSTTPPKDYSQPGLGQSNKVSVGPRSDYTPTGTDIKEARRRVVTKTQVWASKK